MAVTTNFSNFNPKPPDKHHSYASIVTRSTNKFFSTPNQENLIPLKTPSTYKGEPAVFFTNEEIAKLVIPFKFSLIGKFVNGRPSLDSIRKVFTSLTLQSDFTIGLLDEKHILIRLNTEADYVRIFIKAQWNIFNYPMKILKWTPNFIPGTECPIIPIWILLHALPAHLFATDSLESIANTVGRPLQVDNSTATLNRPSVARVCVEVDMTKFLPKRVWVGCEDEGFWQPIQYENLPKYCKQCRRFGHEDKMCIINTGTAGNGKNVVENTSRPNPTLQWIEVKKRSEDKGADKTKTLISETQVDITMILNDSENGENVDEKNKTYIPESSQPTNTLDNISQPEEKIEQCLNTDNATDKDLLEKLSDEPTKCSIGSKSDFKKKEVCADGKGYKSDDQEMEKNSELTQLKDVPISKMMEKATTEVLSSDSEYSVETLSYQSFYDEYLLHRITDPTCTFEDWKKMQNENFQEVVSKKNRKKMKAREKENSTLQKQERQKRTTRKPARLVD